MRHHRRHSHHGSHVRALLQSAVLIALAGCAGGTAGPAPSPHMGRASDAEWRALATPRPRPLDGAARVSVTQIQILGTAPWKLTAPIGTPLGITELVAAGLLRRRDVQYVERRRFAAAVERERRGEARPAGAPRAGKSPGAQYILSAAWIRLGLDSAHVELRLTDAQSGGVVKAWQARTANDADPTAVARTIVGSLLGALKQMNHLPSWTDPVSDAAPSTYRATSVPTSAVDAFFRGVAAEDHWNWDEARRDYQAALSDAGGSFVEARAALARTARLRLGGTLGAN